MARRRKQRKRQKKRHLLKKGVSLLTLAFAGCLANCSTTPPENIDNICAIFEEKPEWYDEAKASEGRWGTPLYVQMAIMHQESSFRDDAKPPRTRLLWVVPWTRPSSAEGYAQAIDGTWDMYKQQTGHHFASRSDFADAIDFIGWYTARTHTTCGVSKWNAEQQYLAYHEGQTGFLQQTYRQKPWLVQTARRVAARAGSYVSQMHRCEPQLASR